jgi:hypothetical protein
VLPKNQQLPNSQRAVLGLLICHKALDPNHEQLISVVEAIVNNNRLGEFMNGL